MANTLLKKLLPEPWPEVLWNWRHYSLWHARRALRDFSDQPVLKQRYEMLNKGLPDDQQALNDGVRFQVIPEMRRIIELYAYLDMRNVVEMNGFLAYARGRDCLLDIGALYGDFSMIFCAMNGRTALAVDPSPEAQALLTRVMAVNPDLDIRPFSVALGIQDGQLRMAREWIHCVAVTNEDNEGQDTVEVKQSTMDSFLAGLDVHPDTIKIDAEGFELDIIQGGRSYLRQYQPRLFLEVHPTYLRKRQQTVCDLVDELHSHNYFIYHPDGAFISNPKRVLANSEGYFVHRVICDVARPGRGKRLTA